MTDANDMELLQDYDRHGSEAAFAALVARHIHLVYSVALRHTGIAAHAEEIAQAVFIILARKAASLRPDTILEGWLHETTRLTALSFRRGERRRQFREQEAYMQSTLSAANDAALWNQLAPMLDEAVSRLGKKDRDAVMLRFFKDQNLREVAAALNVNEAAAQRRVHRAVEKLRGFFTKRGVTLTAAVLTAAISANSVQAAPLGLAATVTAAAVKGAAVSGSTLTLIKGALKVMAWTKVKTAVVVGVGAVLVGTGVYQAQQVAKLREENQTLQQAQAPLAEQMEKLQHERDDATNRLAGLLAENSRLKSNRNELLKLRGQNTLLRNDAAQANDPFVKKALTWKANEAILKNLFDDHPEQRVPELALVSEDQWLAIAKDADLNSEGGIRKAQSEVRHTAKNNFMPDLSSALEKYTKANDGFLPTDLMQLQPYFTHPVDEAILQQYKLTATGRYTSGFVVSDKSVIDQDYDYIWKVGPGSYGPSEVETVFTPSIEMLKPAVAAFMNANQGNNPTSLSQLKPFITTAEQQAAFDKLTKANFEPR